MKIRYISDIHLEFIKPNTPLKNLIRTADYSSSRLPVTDLNEAPQRGADSNLHRYKKRGFNGR